MIEYIKGKIDELNPAFAVIETASGIGYFLNITLPTYTDLEGAKECKLFVHEAIREDSITLYGFGTVLERELFRSLISVSGVGASTARVILSSMKASELQTVIATGDVSRLKSIKGIGAKTAQRIIVDLRDKINTTDDTLIQQPTTNSDVYEEALAALSILGFQRAQSQKVLKKVLEANPSIKVEDAIRQSLAMM